MVDSRVLRIGIATDHVCVAWHVPFVTYASWLTYLHVRWPASLYIARYLPHSLVAALGTTGTKHWKSVVITYLCFPISSQNCDDLFQRGSVWQADPSHVPCVDVGDDVVQAECHRQYHGAASSAVHWPPSDPVLTLPSPVNSHNCHCTSKTTFIIIKTNKYAVTCKKITLSHQPINIQHRNFHRFTRVTQLLLKHPKQILLTRCLFWHPDKTEPTQWWSTHTKYLSDGDCWHVEQNCSREYAFTQFKQWMQRQCSNTWLGPAFSALLYIFLKLYPPTSHQITHRSKPLPHTNYSPLTAYTTLQHCDCDCDGQSRLAQVVNQCCSSHAKTMTV